MQSLPLDVRQSINQSIMAETLDKTNNIMSNINVNFKVLLTIISIFILQESIFVLISHKLHI